MKRPIAGIFLFIAVPLAALAQTKSADFPTRPVKLIYGSTTADLRAEMAARNKLISDLLAKGYVLR